MIPPRPLKLDIHPLVAVQRPPLPAILAAIDQLAPGQSLCLVTPFEPIPLYDLLAKKGFTHEARKRKDSGWDIFFVRR